MDEFTEEQKDAIAHRRREEIPLMYDRMLRIEQHGNAVWLDVVGPGGGVTDIGWVDPDLAPSLIATLVRQTQWAAKAKYREKLKKAAQGVLA